MRQKLNLPDQGCLLYLSRLPFLLIILPLLSMLRLLLLLLVSGWLKWPFTCLSNAIWKWEILHYNTKHFNRESEQRFFFLVKKKQKTIPENWIYFRSHQLYIGMVCCLHVTSHVSPTIFVSRMFFLLPCNLASDTRNYHPQFACWCARPRKIKKKKIMLY